MINECHIILMQWAIQFTAIGLRQKSQSAGLLTKVKIIAHSIKLQMVGAETF